MVSAPAAMGYTPKDLRLATALIRSAPATIAEAYAAGDFERAKLVYRVTVAATMGDLEPFRELARALEWDVDISGPH